MRIPPTVRFTRNTLGVVGGLLLVTVTAPDLPVALGVEVEPSTSRFQILAEFKGEAVLDRETQLIWERSPSTTEAAWANASLRCALSSIGGRLGWRLPTFFELMTLVEPPSLAAGNKPSLPAGHPFRGVSTGLYWTTNSQDTQPTNAYAIDFLRGDLTSQRKNQAHACWCVRGGTSNATATGPSNRPQESI